MSRTLRFEAGELNLRETGLVNARVFPNASVGLEDAKNFFDMILHVTDHGLHASVIDITGISGLEKKAREYLVNECNALGKTAAVAFVTNSIPSRIIGNLFLTVSKPNYPVKIFSDSKRANSWAKEEYLKRVAAVAIAV